MKKLWIVAVVLLLLGGTVVAQPGRGPYIPEDLTAEQQEALQPIWDEMDELRASMREQMWELRAKSWELMAEYGLVSPERAEWLRRGRELADEEPEPGFFRRGCWGHQHRWPVETEPEDDPDEPAARRRAPRGRW